MDASERLNRENTGVTPDHTLGQDTGGPFHPFPEISMDMQEGLNQPAFRPSL